MVDRLGIGTFSIKLAEAVVPIAAGALAFLIVAKLLRVHELEQLSGMVRRKLGR